jgi:hypothetical protein
MTSPQVPLAAPSGPTHAVGGPLFRLVHRCEASGVALPGNWARLLAAAAFAWAPLAAFALFGAAPDGLSFFLDFEVHVKLLVALPVLAAADRVALPRLAAAVRQFVDRGIVAPAERARFDAAVEGAVRARDSGWLEAIVLALIYTVGHWIWREQIALGSATWYATPGPDGPDLTRAGLWYAFVSAPIFRFLVFLWYARLVLWFRLLWTISRLELRLTATHPDRAGGIGFVGNSLYAFSPFLFAQGVLLSGMLANRILHEGRGLFSFRVDVVGLLALVLGLLVAPLLVFSPRLVRAKRQGLREYGGLASRYVQQFDDKWVRSAPPAGESLVGTADLQSLADLGNSFAVVREMRTLPFGLQTLYRLAVALVLPLVPLLLTEFDVEQLLDRLFRMVL